MIQDKEISLDLFYKDVWKSIEAFLLKHPAKILHPHQRERLLKGLSRYLEDDLYGPQYIEVDFHDQQPKNPYGSLERIEEEALLLPICIQESNNQTLEVAEKMDFVQLSEHHYEDQMMQSRLKERIDVNRQSQQEVSQCMSKSISEKENERQNKPLTRSKLKKNIPQTSKIIYNFSENNQIKVEDKNDSKKYLQAQTFIRQEDDSQEEESETYLYYQQKYKCKKRANKKIFFQKIRNKIAKNLLKQPKLQSEKKHLTKGRKPEFPEMEQKLIAWIQKMCTNNIRITQAVIRNRAMILVKQLPNEMNRFRASKGWMQKFFKRHSEIFRILTKRNKSNSVEFIEDQSCEYIKDQEKDRQEIFEE